MRDPFPAFFPQPLRKRRISPHGRSRERAEHAKAAPGVSAGGFIALGEASSAAEAVTRLSWWLFIGGFAILGIVVAGIAIALFGSAGLRRRLATERVVLGLGLVFPVVVLSILLVVGLAMTASIATSEPRPGAVTIEVESERWWWRIRYRDFETANELVIPAGRPVHLVLVSDNVIHAFWVPKLGPKRDMIPGRVNHLTFEDVDPGTYWGVCAEYCGGPHALMQMRVHALPPAEYERWVAQQSRPASVPTSPEAVLGARRFLEIGCGTCHTVRGTPAYGEEGPDLTHVAARSTIGAGILPTTHENFTHWTRFTERAKPGVLMPAYPLIEPEIARSVSDYMVTLK